MNHIRTRPRITILNFVLHSKKLVGGAIVILECASSAGYVQEVSLSTQRFLAIAFGTHLAIDGLLLRENAISRLEFTIHRRF